LLALLQRAKTGKGQRISVSLYDSMLAAQTQEGAAHLMRGREVNWGAMPLSGVFETSDGYFNIGAAGEAIYQRFCKAIDAPELASDPDFATNADRSKNRHRLHEAINVITRQRSSADWIARFNAAGVPCGPIYKMDEVFADPQVQHLNITRHVQHEALGDLEVVGQAVELSRTPWSVRSATPEPGEHTDEVLRELGFDDAAIAGLHARKAV